MKHVEVSLPFWRKGNAREPFEVDKT